MTSGSLSHSRITSGSLSHSRDYLWSAQTEVITLGHSQTVVITLGHSQTEVITSGRDYFWSSLTQKWLPLVLSHTEVITPGSLSHSRNYLWSSHIVEFTAGHPRTVVVTSVHPYTGVITSGQLLHRSDLIQHDYLWSPSQSRNYLWTPSPQQRVPLVYCLHLYKWGPFSTKVVFGNLTKVGPLFTLSHILYAIE